ncbi:MAG TPA: FAD/NAD(P)-binding protein [Candidatus Baltobacteraceae bacterium]|jgi:uncharacterized NAD(P)/FAD-binding protein YdhS|nr:FAD/NAD(P)-binding protein [Candidatus Baltobacteraceae bacterium]
MPDSTIAIVGGGASGALLAAALLERSRSAKVIVFEPRAQLGTGVAYSTDCPLHLLNVPAGKMSAFAGDPGHFIRWLDDRYPATYGAHSFVPRQIYGEYLQSIVSRTARDAGDRFTHVRDSVVDVVVEGEDAIVCSSGGAAVRADAVVIACGNAAPAPVRGFALEGRSPRYFASAWDKDALVPENEDDTVLLIGTGLTSVDAVLGLRHNGHRGTIYMVSRRGLLPHEHRLFDAPPDAFSELENANDLLGAARLLTRGAKNRAENWRVSMERVRPATNALWQTSTLSDQRRFLRHVLPYWNIHRHRMAPEVVRLLADLTASNTLHMLAGRTGDAISSDDHIVIPVKLRGKEETLRIRAQRVINCSGPMHDFRRLENPLVQNLLERGLMAPYPLNIGVQVAGDGALIDARGNVSQRVFSIGPVRFGALIETTAIPEIRAQAAALAHVLAGRDRSATTA